MKKRHCTFWILAGVVTSLLMTQFSAMAADKVVVIPLFRSSDRIPTVTSTTGRVWMDRNLGAIRVAQSKDDYQAYGWLYQWGRLADGHETGHSPTTTTRSNGDVPGHDNFIILSIPPPLGSDWRIQQNDNLWQGVSGGNNPCPAGFRVPTETEWDTERASWSENNSAGAFASPLKLVVAGYRHSQLGTVHYTGILGNYWSSTTNGNGARYLYFRDDADMSGSSRAWGISVRCIKD